MTESGKLIVLEAVDDIVLDRLAERLCHWLREQGLAAERTREPTCGPAGAQVLLARQGRVQFDATSLALLYLADRLDHMQRADGIAKWIEAGQYVVCSHYGLAAAARLWGQVEWDWLCRIGYPAPEPELCIFLDLPVGEGAQKHLRDGYLAAIQRLQDDGQAIMVIEGDVALDEVELTCQEYIARSLRLKMSQRGTKGLR